MHRFRVLTASILLIGFGLSGCATVPGTGETTWSSPAACITAYTAGGAILGAAAGLGIGLLTGRKDAAATGAIIGGISGGTMAFAYAWGKCFASFSKVKSEQVTGYAQTAKEENYSPQQGVKAKIKDYAIDPSAVAPGGTLNFHANYYVMAPPDKKDLTVTETRILKVYNPQKKQFEEMNGVPETVVISPGTRGADGEVPVPSNAQEGKFMIAFKIECEGKSDVVEMPFMITKDQNILNKASQDSLDRQAREKKETPVQLVSAKDIPTGAKSVQDQPEKLVTVIATRANVRENPSTKAKIVKSISKDEKYPWSETKTAEKRKWYRIDLDDGKNGWVAREVVKVSGE